MSTTITPMDITGQGQPQSAAVEAIPATPEAAAPVETKPVATDPLSPKFAALARQQKMLRQQQIEIQEAKKAMEAERQAIEQAKTWKQRITQDPYGVMLEAGLTADQVAALMLQQPNPEDQKFTLLQQELKSVKEAQEQARQDAEQAQKRQYDDAVKQIRSDVDALVRADDSYETIRAMGASEAVVALIEETFNQDGRLMTVDEAAREVEAYLEEEATKLLGLKKLQARIKPAQPEVPQKQVTQNLQSQPSQLRTLSNRVSTSVAQPLTDKQRKERAILAFQGKLT